MMAAFPKITKRGVNRTLRKAINCFRRILRRKAYSIYSVTPTPSGDVTLKCEIKHLDLRYDDQDEQYYEERKTEIEKPEQKDWWRLFAFCLVKQYDDDGDYVTTRLYVNSQPLRQLLEKVIGVYYYDPINYKNVQIKAPYNALFYFREEIESEGLNRFKNDEESTAQLKLLVSWIKSHFEINIAAYDRCVSDLRAIAYDQVWTLFPPRKIIHTKAFNQSRAYRVHSCWYVFGKMPYFNILVDSVDFDGENLGTRRWNLLVHKYTGTRQLKELSTMPLDLLDDADELRAGLIERGRKFESYIGRHFEYYNGIAVEKTGPLSERVHVKGRIMVDCEMYHRRMANDKFFVTEFDSTAKLNVDSRKGVDDVDLVPEPRSFDKLSDEEALIASPTIRGYAFSTKMFLKFYVDSVSPIEWNASCFDDLVLDPGTKKTVQAVVSTHSSNSDNSDDIIKGKGQGLVCVLHGPPGVGKTLTAECVAEYLKRPLYTVSSGDLGVSSMNLDLNLKRIMDLASTWKAVLLIDEADIFLERRSPYDVHRNAMVSTFLRALEYYSGILFLTTNRVNTFDDGFRSRIHVPIRYTDLSFASRLQIWRTLCGRVPGGVDVDDAGLENLARHDFNGRQIKNIINAARSLAAFDGVKVDFAQLSQVTKIQDTFEKDLTTFGQPDYTVPGESKDGRENRSMFL
ncbi:P-loop containing nucleoside triphosphate hydrolase protein [Hypoxylon crocopeplum]|nr:P-loop containing nucleoside triphosphate hydrolase protein [Hypoxylon crocopeplum]